MQILREQHSGMLRGVSEREIGCETPARLVHTVWTELVREGESALLAQELLLGVGRQGGQGRVEERKGGETGEELLEQKGFCSRRKGGEGARGGREKV